MNKTNLFVSMFLIAPLFGQGPWVNLQVRGGGYIPLDSMVQQVYGRGGPEVEGEVQVGITDQVGIWANANYFSRTGHSVGLNAPTHLRLIPLSIGLKGFIPIAQQWELYAGIGGTYSIIHIHDDSLFLTSHINQNRPGFVVKGGFMRGLSDNTFLDVFVDYYYTTMTINNIHRNLGGLRIGAGLGLKF